MAYGRYSCQHALLSVAWAQLGQASSTPSALLRGVSARASRLKKNNFFRLIRLIKNLFVFLEGFEPYDI